MHYEKLTEQILHWLEEISQEDVYRHNPTTIRNLREAEMLLLRINEKIKGARSDV